MLDNGNAQYDYGKVIGLLLTELSKAFDCLSHELLIARLHAYAFNFAALRLTHSYFINKKQRTRINSNYNSLEEILFGVTQGSIVCTGACTLGGQGAMLRVFRNYTDQKFHDFYQVCYNI